MQLTVHSRYGDWKKDNGGYQAHLDPIWRLERAQQTTIFRLRTGHCGLRAHLKIIGISDTSFCKCGQADQTTDHVLQSCPKYAERRQLIWPKGADLEIQAVLLSRRPLPDDWFCGINWTDDLTCMAVDRWRRRRRRLTVDQSILAHVTTNPSNMLPPVL